MSERTLSSGCPEIKSQVSEVHQGRVTQWLDLTGLTSRLTRPSINTFTLTNVLPPMLVAAMESPSHHSPSPMSSRPISVARQPPPSVQSSPNVFCNSPSLSVHGTPTPSIIPSMPDSQSEISSQEIFSESCAM
ncbi:hypothetical protein PIIN_10179 [Serendipita indica DSM 11827]|uniref:Uncharacterized protein n=1 Tax=Serendipita indica (strain DSM 11827) TaxID=1109443 RepID=G4TXZ3_SERID|nr:hypothetical protein PIIN_10179 [Serendipita indica DSM 11827]